MKKGEWFTFHQQKREYVCTKEDLKTKAIFQHLLEHHFSDISIENGHIEKIESCSGVFQLLFHGDCGATFYTTGQLYYGFGSSICIGDVTNEKTTLDATSMFLSFLVSLMSFYGVSDLLQLGGNVEKFPVVELHFDDENVLSSVTNTETGMGFSVGNGYSFLSTSTETASMKKKKYKL